jgi:hypothetical protein
MSHTGCRRRGERIHTSARDGDVPGARSAPIGAAVVAAGIIAAVGCSFGSTARASQRNWPEICAAFRNLGHTCMAYDPGSVVKADNVVTVEVSVFDDGSTTKFEFRCPAVPDDPVFGRTRHGQWIQVTSGTPSETLARKLCSETPARRRHR